MIQVNTIIRLIFICLISYIGMPSQKILAQTKKALIIGVGNYPVEGGWASLSSKNDVQLIKSTLVERGFAEDNITLLLDDKATRKGILETLQKDFLGKINKNDVVYIQFSGHGQQKRDFDGDETDGLDECIVPYDSPKKFQKGVYEGQNLITDDELGSSLRSIRSKIGSNGQLLVVLDACHSGTGTRGFGGKARGTSEAMADPDYLKNRQINSNSQDNNELQRRDNLSVANLAPMVAFFGSAQNQLNYEMTTESGEHYGSLSYALAKGLANATPDESYRGLFDKIRLQMSTIAPLQSPQSEGDLDLEIANGKLLKKPTYYKAFKVNSESEFVIRAGELHGLLSGSEIGLYPTETRDLSTAKSIATGKITKCFPSESVITLSTPVAVDIIKSAWIFITEKSMGDLIITVTNKVNHPEIAKAINERIFSKPFVKMEAQNPKLIIQEDATSKSIVMVSFDGYTIDSIPFQVNGYTDLIINRLTQSIRKYLHGEFIRKMEIEGSDIKVTFKIIPVDSITDENDYDNLKALQVDASSGKKMKLKSEFKFLIINEGVKPAYFTILDLQPDNAFTILIPKEPSTPEEMRILQDQKLLFPVEFEVNAPLGHEVFKLISSDRPIDLKSSLGTRGKINPSPFEKLFHDSTEENKLQTRGTNSGNLSTSDINIYSDTFTITK